MLSLISSLDRREIEEKTENHRETVEELIELKKKLTSRNPLLSFTTSRFKEGTTYGAGAIRVSLVLQKVVLRIH